MIKGISPTMNLLTVGPFFLGVNNLPGQSLPKSNNPANTGIKFSFLSSNFQHLT